MGQSNYLHFDDVNVLAETEKAFRVSISDNDWEGWVPKSQIADADSYSTGESC